MLKKLSSKYAFIVSSVSSLAASTAFAIDDATVTAAQTAGEASVLNATTGVIAIVAVVVGLSIVMGIMKKV